MKDIYFIFRREFYLVFRDHAVLTFFIFLCLGYPLIYTFKMCIRDSCSSYKSTVVTTEYTIEYFTADIGVDEYIERFRDEARFIEPVSYTHLVSAASSNLPRRPM